MQVILFNNRAIFLNTEGIYMNNLKNVINSRKGHRY
jgi:hypothetical protein